MYAVFHPLPATILIMLKNRLAVGRNRLHCAGTLLTLGRCTRVQNSNDFNDRYPLECLRTDSNFNLTFLILLVKLHIKCKTFTFVSKIWGFFPHIWQKLKWLVSEHWFHFEFTDSFLMSSQRGLMSMTLLRKDILHLPRLLNFGQS